ncbi:hypothetical protein D3C76_460380 [compost metagenome]
MVFYLKSSKAQVGLQSEQDVLKPGHIALIGLKRQCERMALVIPQPIEVGLHFCEKRLISLHGNPQIILQIVIIQIACSEVSGTAKKGGAAGLLGDKEQLRMILFFGGIVPTDRDFAVRALVQVHGNGTVGDPDFITPEGVLIGIQD